MTKDELIKKLIDFRNVEMSLSSMLDAVEAYTAASNGAKPIVTSSVHSQTPKSKNYKQLKIKK